MFWQRLLVASLCLLFPATASFADSGLSAVRLTGSRPLLVFALGQPDLPPEAREAASAISASMGYESTGFGTLTEREFRIFPSLRYDGNINGGYENSAFDVAGFTFAVGPEAQAKPGILVGANFRTGLTASLVENFALDAHAEGSFEVSPEHRLTKSSLYTDVCLRHRASLSIYFHACADGIHRRFELGESTRAGVRVGATHIMAFGGGLHEVSAELRLDEYFREDLTYTQPVASVGIVSALPGPTALFANADFGRDEPGVMTMKTRLRIGGARTVLGQPTSVSLGWQEASGGVFFNTQRVDHTHSAQIRRKISDRVSVGVTASKTDSTVEFFESSSVGAQVNVRF